jgi:hypothetical protein
VPGFPTPTRTRLKVRMQRPFERIGTIPSLLSSIIGTIQLMVIFNILPVWQLTEVAAERSESLHATDPQLPGGVLSILIQ